MDRVELDNRFIYHSPNVDQVTYYSAIRQTAKEFAEFIVDSTPESREQSLAITALEETVFWANAAIARRS